MVVRDRVNTALTIAAEGCKADIAKPLRGFSPGVMEIAVWYRTDAWRVVYAMETNGGLWVIHAFRKKSKSGIETEGRDRLGQRADESPEKGVVETTETDFELVEGSANLFRDLDDPHADPKQAKAILAARIIAVLGDRGLSVIKAAVLTRFAAADFSRIRNADPGALYARSADEDARRP